MKGHAQASTEERIRSMGELRLEIQGRLPSGPFEFAEDLHFNALPGTGGTSASDKFNRAVMRDAAYGSAGGPYIRLFGMSQSLRHIYDGGRQLIDGGGAV
jgi:hypothetical protein